MENEIYNQNEIKFFTDVFNYVKSSLRCDISGNISAEDIHDFLLTSKLSKDIISQIGDITGGAIQGWYGEKQFFLALKLVAAAQQGIPVTSHIPFLEIDLPLPQLFTNNNTEYDRSYSKDAISKQHKYESSPNLINLSDSDCPQPKASDNGYQIMISEDGEDEAVEGIYSEPTSNFTSHSPSVSSPASDSPTPTNSGGALEKRWNEPLNAQWHIIVNEEHHQLLGTEEESSDRHSSEGKDEEEEEEYNDGCNCESESEKETVKMEEKCVNDDDEKVKEEEHIDVNDDDDDIDDDDVWTITEEQQQYYTKQFTIMQSDLNGFIPGTIAKPFFEKSKLPVAELRQIWQLADVSRDGALSLEEFFAAMHLVVLRRNKIPLPDKLPKALLPKSFKWTKFIDSPTSTLSSPGPKPVNFDFHKSALEKDPKILHPTPLRVTPEANRFEVQEESVLTSSHEKEVEEAIREPCTLNLMSSSFNLEDEKISNSPISQSNFKGESTKSCLGQTQNFKNSEENEECGSTSLPSFCHVAPSQHTQPLLHLKDIPPPPPPRPSRTHVRSSSLDLNKFSKTVSHKSPPPATTGSPSILMKKYVENGPPLSPSWDPRMTNVHEEEISITSDHIRNSVTKHNHNSAFEIYKKPYEEGGSASESKKEVVSEEDDEEEDTSQVTSLSVRQNDKREILSSLQTLKEKNSVLQRVNSELNQELAEMIEERIALEFQLEQMKSFST